MNAFYIEGVVVLAEDFVVMLGCLCAVVVIAGDVVDRNFQRREYLAGFVPGLLIFVANVAADDDCVYMTRTNESDCLLEAFFGAWVRL